MSKRNLYKIVILGDSAVGKTSLLHSYVDQKFLNSYKATIGADMMETDVAVDGKVASLIVFDTAGQQRFRSMGEAFYRGANCCVIVYDTTKKESFNNVQSWINQFMNKGSPQQPQIFPFILIGNKIDKQRQRQVQDADIEQFTRKNPKIKHLKASAKNQEGVLAAFQEIARAALQYKKYFIPVQVPSTKLKTLKGNKKNNKTCC